MKQQIKKSITIIMLILLFLFFSNAIYFNFENYNTMSYTHYKEHALAEVGAKNIVTGIYLDYRLFDSIFEASILFIAITGIAFIARKDDDLL